MPVIDPECRTMKKWPWKPFTIKRFGRAELIVSGPGLSAHSDLTFYDKQQARDVATALSLAYRAGATAARSVGKSGLAGRYNK